MDLFLEPDSSICKEMEEEEKSWARVAFLLP